VAALVQLLLLGAPGALAAVKELLAGIVSQRPDALRHFTSQRFANRVTSDEGREGVQAFVEKRKSAWDET
jgi:enoyl-CoA hydratase/carnithine racemase